MPIFAPGVASGILQGQDAMRQQAEQAQLMAQRKQQMQYQAWQEEQARTQAAAQLQAQQADTAAWKDYGVPASAAPAPAPGQNFAPPQGQPQGGGVPAPQMQPSPSAGSQPQGNPVPAYRTVANTSAPTGQPQGQNAGPMTVPPVQPQQQQQQQLMTLDSLIESFKRPSPEYPNGIPEKYWSGLIKKRMQMLEYEDRQRAAAIADRRLSDSEAKTAADEASKPPIMRTRISGDKEIQEQWNPATRLYDKIGEGPRFARQVAGAGSGSGGAGAVTGDASVGPEVATGKPINQIFPGMSKDAANMRKTARTAGIDEIMKQTGMSRADAGAELALRNIEYNSGRTTDSKMALMEGTTRQAVKQLDFNVNAVNKEMAKLKSTDALPVLNALARGVEKWDGDPAYSSLFYYMNAAATESARILSGGTGSVAQLHQGAMEEAQKWANMNMTPAMWKSVASAMQEEGQSRLDTYRDARSSSRLGNTNTGGQSESGPKKIANDADYNALPSGAEFIAPDGTHRKKP